MLLARNFMSTILAKRYSSYLTSEYKYDRRLRFWKIAFKSIYKNIAVNIKKINLNKNIYNKYKYASNIIYDFSQYDIRKVYNVCLDDISYLLKSLKKENILGLKKILDEIPNNKKVILKDWYLQQTCFADIEFLYPASKRLNIENIEFENFYTSLQSPSYHSNLENGSFLQKYILINHLYKTLFISIDSLEKLNYYFLLENKLTQLDIKNSFESFFNLNKLDIAKEILRVISKTVYLFTNPSSVLVNTLANNILPKIEIFKELFFSYCDDNMKNYFFDLNRNLEKFMFYKVSIDRILEVFDNPDYYDQSDIESFITYEEDIIKRYFLKVNMLNLKEYLFLLFLYKSHAAKFLNVLPSVVENYINNFLKPIDEVVTYDIDILRVLNKTYNSVNFSNLANMLNIFVTNSNLITICESDEIPCFVFMQYFIELFDNFLNTSIFDDYIEDLLKDIYENLYRLGHISYDCNWCENKEAIRIYFRAYLRYQLSQRLLFDDILTTYENSVYSVLSNTTGNTDYDITIDFQEQKLKIIFQNIKNSSNNFQRFFENHISSTLTVEISEDFLMYFLVSSGIGFLEIGSNFSVS